MKKLLTRAGSVAVVASALIVNFALWIVILASMAWLADAATSVVGAAANWAGRPG